MRLSSVITVFPRLLMFTSFSLGLGSVWGLGLATAAQACGESAIVAIPMDPPEENTPVNFRLGMTEAAFVQTFGKPQARHPEPVRCPSNRIHLTYAKSLIVLSPNPATHNPQLNHSRSALNSPNSQDLVVIGLVSTDPQVVFTGGIHVGLSTITAEEKLTATCDRDSLEKSPSHFSCLVAHQPVNVRIINNQVSRMTIGTIHQQKPDK
jgi:hypothetical protein